MPPLLLLALTIGPALAIGLTLWFVNDLLPACTVTEHQRLTAPDDAFDLVTFSRACGPTEANMQAALVPPGEQVPFDAASFVSIAAESDLRPRWDAYGNIELTLPEGADIYRQDENVAGVAVIYR
ncbi:hypothetical protein O9Z70_09910 [Devosia sp. YIM 151766]|uniref:hypothetical protein n=1 Tax=Devosia sp. YIM 151766 TaxID=3017325 RepID=UPI00255C63D1|nr:hypothetical protein [Devosia sp. YIM 151766]WIY51799.1 hypothetical protein O9Z70_09910 [Devosia sp. YIM 151766]